MNFEWTPLGKKWTTVNLSNSSLLPFWRNRKHKESNNGGVCWCLPFPSIWSLLDQSPYCVNSDSHGGECGFYWPGTSCFRVMFKFCILVLRFLDIVNVEYISFKQIKNIRSRNGKSLLCKKKEKGNFAAARLRRFHSVCQAANFTTLPSPLILFCPGLHQMLYFQTASTSWFQFEKCRSSVRYRCLTQPKVMFRWSQIFDRIICFNNFCLIIICFP